MFDQNYLNLNFNPLPTNHGRVTHSLSSSTLCPCLAPFLRRAHPSCSTTSWPHQHRPIKDATSRCSPLKLLTSVPHGRKQAAKATIGPSTATQNNTVFPFSSFPSTSTFLFPFIPLLFILIFLTFNGQIVCLSSFATFSSNSSVTVATVGPLAFF